MDDKEKLDRIETPKPLVKIKTGIVFVAIGIFILMIVFSLISHFNKPKITTKNLPKKAKIIEEPTYDIKFSDFSEKADGKKAITPKTKLEIPLNQNSGLDDDFYKQKVQNELRARNSSPNFMKKNIASINKNGENNSSSIKSPSFNNVNNDINNTFNDPNMQKAKKEFANNAKQSKFHNNYDEEYSPLYTLKAGSVIPIILVSGINSDLPSNVIATVRENVYDTVTGNYLLIPRGTRILGKYDSGVSFGQNRILIVWQRLMFADGKTIGLANFGGIDMSGYAGVTGKVNNHFVKLLEAVVFSSVLGAGTAITANDNDNNNNDSIKETAAKGAGEQIMAIGAQMAQKTLNIQPTITIKPGIRMNIMVNSDIRLTPEK